MNKYRFEVTAEITLNSKFDYHLAWDMAEFIANRYCGIVNTCSSGSVDHWNDVIGLGYAWINMGFLTKYHQQQALKMLRRRARGKPRFSFIHGPATVTFKSTPTGEWTETVGWN